MRDIALRDDAKQIAYTIQTIEKYGFFDKQAKPQKRSERHSDLIKQRLSESPEKACFVRRIDKS